jgi:5-methyltetrahydrofolate--homocysteine methyltransferase
MRSSSSGAESFVAWLKAGPRVGDGAMGTMLQQAGLALDGCPESWNLEWPERVSAVHLDYRDAGAEVLQTNSFGGNWFRLRHVGLAERMVEVNRAAVRLAREAAGNGGPLVAGCVGPTGGRLAFPAPARDTPALCDRVTAPHLFPLTPEEAAEAFAAQAAVLDAAGVDLLLIETMTDVAEAQVAVRAARAVTALPVVATMTFGRDGRTMAGGDPAERVPARRAGVLLAEAGAAAVGANCGEGPAALLPVIERLRAALPALPLVAQPSAGLPRWVRGRPVYDVDPATMAIWACRLVEAGADLVGGCCGSTPDHIRAIRAALGAEAAADRRSLPRHLLQAQADKGSSGV